MGGSERKGSENWERNTGAIRALLVINSRNIYRNWSPWTVPRTIFFREN